MALLCVLTTHIKYQGFNLSFFHCNCITICNPSPESHLSTKLLTLVKLCLVSVTEMPWLSRYQLMVGGGFPLATHFRDREGPKDVSSKIPHNYNIISIVS